MGKRPNNERHLSKDIQKLNEYFLHILKEQYQKDRGLKLESAFPSFSKHDKTTPYGKHINRLQINDSERVILLLALIPHFQPNFFESVILNLFPQGTDLPEIGGAKGKNHRGMLPTGETAFFLLKEINSRQEVYSILSKNHYFAKENILYLEPVPTGEPKLSGRILLSEESADYLITGGINPPDYGINFPAHLITTKLEWSDLVLQEKTLSEILEIEVWLKYNDTLLNDWGLQGKIKPGYRVLFYGPPGTGKTMTASLLGKHTGRDVFRIDLSMVVSKFIGETEKNLAKLFDKATNKDWILFFDEADSIFGKRTSVRDAHDKYANQEVSYLLQRIESHSGLVILASNMKDNIDTAFTRRFNSIIEFVNPGVDERMYLWKNYLPKNIVLDRKISLPEIARKYDLTGANIVNVIQYVGLQTLLKKSDEILEEDLLKGIEKEYGKEGKVIRRT